MEKIWVVRLGAVEWLRFTYERMPGDRLRLIGSISKGGQRGALAAASDGQFVQVNGDYETPLPAGAVRRAIAQATAEEARLGCPRASRAARTVTVIVKRRRTVPQQVG